MSNVEILIARIPKIRKTGRDSWRGCCPGHGGDNPNTLTIRETSDGRVLMHCFKGCAPNVILESIGLGISDLFSERIINHAHPEKIRFNSGDLLKVIRHEAQIVCVAAYDLRKGKALPDADMARLNIAMSRINEILEMNHGY